MDSSSHIAFNCFADSSSYVVDRSILCENI